MKQETSTDTFQPLVRGVAQAGVRAANERAVMTLVAGIPGSSNADLARFTGLGPQTTARILADLEGRSLVQRGAVLRGRRGQPATPYWLNPEGAYSIGIDLNWAHAEVLLFSLGGTEVARRRITYRYPRVEEVFPEIARMIQEVTEGLTPAQRERIVGAALAAPATMGLTLTRLGATPAETAAWLDYDMAERIRRDTGYLPIRVNDGSAAAFCQITNYPTPRPDRFAALYIGTYVGGGIVAQGQLWEGPSGNAADLGSTITVDFDGKVNFAHGVASLYALCQRLRAAGLRPDEPSPYDWDWDVLESVVGPWLDVSGYVLAQTVVNTRAMLDVSVVVLDGNMPAPILERLHAETRRHMQGLTWLGHGMPELVLGNVGAPCVALGAAQLVMFRTFFSRASEALESLASK